MTNTEALVDSRQMREKYADRVEVLDKVKLLFLIPELECMTTQQIAEYYEVDVDAIQKTCQRNKGELVEDGMSLKSASYFKSLIVTKCPHLKITQLRGRFVIHFNDECDVVIPNTGIRIFPKRAILRMGMLLRDSSIAKEVRTQLLNIVEATPDETKVAAINEEKTLLNNIGKAYGTGNFAEVLKATLALDDFRKRHIRRIENDCKVLEEEKAVLAAEVNRWSDRSSLSRAMRALSGLLKVEYCAAYSMLFQELLYKHHISLKARGGKPYVQWLKPEEYKKAYQSIAAMCEVHGISAAKLFEKAKINMSEAVS